MRPEVTRQQHDLRANLGTSSSADIELIHSISVELIAEKDIQALYTKILDAAVAIMRSQFASMQTLDLERGPKGGPGELHLLSARGYSEEAIRQFEWVRSDMNTSCGISLRSGARTIITDIEEFDELADTPALAAFRQTGIRAMQTTPLLSRSGQLLGMITTHWSEPHEPSSRDLRLIDILARQAADLLERTQAEAALQTRERQLDAILGAVTDAFLCVDSGFKLTFANERCASRLDKTPAQLIGKSMYEALPYTASDTPHRELVRAMRERVVTEFEFYHELSDKWFSEKAYPTSDGGLAIYSQDITDRKRAEDLRQMLTGELSHRVKNMLATVQAIATQTLRRSTNSADFVQSFGGRIQSMSLVHSQLSNNDWKGAQLRELVCDQVKLGPIDETRVTATGPDVSLDARIVPQVAMILHELGTNSIKYGALSTPAGKIDISWTIEHDQLHMLWKEAGGPPVCAPLKRGLGTTLIEQSAKGAGGKAQMTIDVSGVAWDIRLLMPQASPTKFTVATPSSDWHRLAIVEPSERSARRILAGRKFLIVEDEPLVAMDIADLLEGAGAEVVGSTGNVTEALRYISGSVLHGVLLDANLFGSPVDEIAAELTRKGVPFAFVTGYGPLALPKAFRSALILPKPYTAQQILDGACQLVSERDDVISLKRRGVPFAQTSGAEQGAE